MALSREMQRNIELDEQDSSKESDLSPVANAENKQDRIASENSSYPGSFFSYIASFYTPTDSSDSSDSLNQVPQGKRSRAKQYNAEINVNAENTLLYNETRDKSTADNCMRKRKSDRANWTRNIRKTARIQGKPYISTTGVIQPGKMLKEPCACRKKCFEKFNEKDRENIFMEFYKLSDEAQNQQIACSIEEYPKKTVRLRDKNAASTKEGSTAGKREESAADGTAAGTKNKHAAGTSRRSFSRKYFLNKPDMARIEVCQTMYLNTLAITLMKVRVIVQKKRTRGEDVCYEDGRGKHGKQKQTSDEAKQRIMNYIAQFPAYCSQDSRSPNTDKK